MQTKEHIENPEENGNVNSNFAVEKQSDKNLIATLEGLGYLPKNFEERKEISNWEYIFCRTGNSETDYHQILREAAK